MNPYYQNQYGYMNPQAQYGHNMYGGVQQTNQGNQGFNIEAMYTTVQPYNNR